MFNNKEQNNIINLQCKSVTETFVVLLEHEVLHKVNLIFLNNDVPIIFCNSFEKWPKINTISSATNLGNVSDLPLGWCQLQDQELSVTYAGAVVHFNQYINVWNVKLLQTVVFARHNSCPTVKDRTSRCSLADPLTEGHRAWRRRSRSGLSLQHHHYNYFIYKELCNNFQHISN